MSNDKNVVHPPHYNSDPSGVECLAIVRHRNFNVGNAIKYLWRAGLKGKDTQVEDLRKAIFCIEDEIKRVGEEAAKVMYGDAKAKSDAVSVWTVTSKCECCFSSVLRAFSTPADAVLASQSSSRFCSTCGTITLHTHGGVDELK